MSFLLYLVFVLLLRLRFRGVNLALKITFLNKKFPFFLFPFQELQVHRTWSVDEHPEWLVFEAEGLLQIRPKQYSVALDLMQNPGAITQLNMGEGKTRVIIPMLMLHWTRSRDSIVSFKFLPVLTFLLLLFHQYCIGFYNS